LFVPDLSSPSPNSRLASERKSRRLSVRTLRVVAGGSFRPVSCGPNWALVSSMDRGKRRTHSPCNRPGPLVGSDRARRPASRKNAGIKSRPPRRGQRTPSQLPTLRLLSYEHSPDFPQKPALPVSQSPITGAARKATSNVLLSLGDALAWTGWAGTVQSSDDLGVSHPRWGPAQGHPFADRNGTWYCSYVDWLRRADRRGNDHENRLSTPRRKRNRGIANTISSGAGRKRATAKSPYHHVHSRRPAET
jgi:hypothetical protein